MGEAADTLRTQAKAAGDLETLAELDNAPKVEGDFAFYFTAFVALDSERQHGMALSRIPRSKIMEYGEEAGLTYDERCMLYDVIRLCDDAHLEALAERRNK